MKKIKLTPTEWQSVLGFEVIDPDGWDRRPDKFEADWNTPISFCEFMEKADVSTCSSHPRRGNLIIDIISENFI